MILKNIFSAIAFFILHHGKQRRNIIILGGSLLAIGFIGMITSGSIVIQDTVNQNLKPNGYPKTAIFGISVYSYEYASLFITILGVFVFTGGIVAMDSKIKQKSHSWIVIMSSSISINSIQDNHLFLQLFLSITN